MASIELRYGPPTGKDSRQYRLKVLLRGHRDALIFDIRSGDVDRLFEAVQDEPEPGHGESEEESTSPYIVFDSTALRVAINLRAAMFIQFLWEPAGTKVISPTGDEAKPSTGDENVCVFFDQNAIPVEIGIEPEDDDENNERNYLWMVFDQLKTGLVEPHQRMYILDEDGEDVFLRAGDISLLTCPLWLLEPKIRDAREMEEL